MYDLETSTYENGLRFIEADRYDHVVLYAARNELEISAFN